MYNPEARACARKRGPDCQYLTSALSWWCAHAKCSQERGTTIPGVIHCPYYEPRKPATPDALEDKTMKLYHEGKLYADIDMSRLQIHYRVGGKLKTVQYATLHEMKDTLDFLENRIGMQSRRRIASALFAMAGVMFVLAAYFAYCST